MMFGVALEVLRKEYKCRIATHCPDSVPVNSCNGCEFYTDSNNVIEALKTVLDAFGNGSEIPNSSGDLIDRAEAQTELQFAARRYTVAHEAHGEGQVVWSDNLISVTDAMNALRKVPSVQAQQMIPTQMSGTSNSSTKFKPGSKFLLEIGEKRIGLDEYSIVGTDLYVWGSLLEKLTPYEPTVQAEQKKGHWIPVDDPSITGRCSVCGFESHLCEDDVYGYDYCPNCGARLEVVDE